MLLLFRPELVETAHDVSYDGNNLESANGRLFTKKTGINGDSDLFQQLELIGKLFDEVSAASMPERCCWFPPPPSQ